MIKGIRINKSKIVHLYWEGTDRTDCGAGGMSDITENGGVPTTDPVTCKRCLKTVADIVERDWTEALKMNDPHFEADALLAELKERDWTEAIEENAARDAARRAREIADAITSYQIRRAENMGQIREEDHAEALAEDLERSSRPHWMADQFGTWKGSGGETYICDLPVKRGTPGHDGPCFDRVAGVQRSAPVLSHRQRRASRRAARVTLRRQAPQMRAAACARRAQRGTARATAQALLVASGVPQDVAERYASAFSRGAQAETVPMRIRNGARRSKRVDVKRYTWLQFRAQLRVYRPAALVPRVWFNEAAGRVGVLA